MIGPIKSNGILIKSDRDRYVLLFEQRYLNNVKEDKFSILDKIKEVDTREKVQFTLSIAFQMKVKQNRDKYKSAQADGCSTRTWWRPSSNKGK